MSIKALNRPFQKGFRRVDEDGDTMVFWCYIKYKKETKHYRDGGRWVTVPQFHKEEEVYQAKLHKKRMATLVKEDAKMAKKLRALLIDMEVEIPESCTTREELWALVEETRTLTQES